VAKAYKLLERDSIIEMKGYRGTYVHPRAKANCKFNLQEWTQRKLGEVIAELREAGVTDSEIRNAFAGTISRQLTAK
jgi:GntR family transcriptional regulator